MYRPHTHNHSQVLAMHVVFVILHISNEFTVASEVGPLLNRRKMCLVQPPQIGEHNLLKLWRPSCGDSSKTCWWMIAPGNHECPMFIYPLYQRGFSCAPRSPRMEASISSRKGLWMHRWRTPFQCTSVWAEGGPANGWCREMPAVSTPGFFLGWNGWCMLIPSLM